MEIKDDSSSSSEEEDEDESDSDSVNSIRRSNDRKPNGGQSQAIYEIVSLNDVIISNL